MQVLTRAHPAKTLAAATLVLALAAGFGQTAMAQPGHGGHHGGPGIGMMGGGRHMDRALESVGASAEQRAQIRQIMQSARADLKGQRETRRQLREQMQALFAQPTVDARAVESLRQQQMAQRDQASKRLTQAMLDASRVLSAEQRKALADRFAQRKAMRERHRAEREALGQPAR